MTNWHGETPVGKTVEWYTPPEFFTRLGMTFDLDPAMPVQVDEPRCLRGCGRPAIHRDHREGGYDSHVYRPEPPVPWVPVTRWYTPNENGLMQPWEGRVWLNPPYGRQAVPFLHRLAEHGDGVALVFSRTETAWWRSVAPRADLVCFLRDRLRHIRADGHQGRGAMGSALLVFGAENVAPVIAADLGWCVRSIEAVA